MGYYSCSYGKKEDPRLFSVYSPTNGEIYNSQIFPIDLQFNQSIGTLDEPIIIGNKVQQCSNLLRGASYLNSLVTLGQNMISCNNLFYQCSNFNQPVIIPNSVIYCNSMFYYCS